MQGYGGKTDFMEKEHVDSKMGMFTRVIMSKENDTGKGNAILQMETCMWVIGKMIPFMVLEDTITIMDTG